MLYLFSGVKNHDLSYELSFPLAEYASHVNETFSVSFSAADLASIIPLRKQKVSIIQLTTRPWQWLV